MPKSLDLIVGIIMAATGVYCFACAPMARRRFAELERAGKLTADDVKSKMKILKLAAFCSLFVGSGIICIYVFKLYD